ncbi:MAG: autotransporter outer membrane beta-barrel domain-containing protein [Candidatus Devosia phytovorans]|uniref:Autotransporter outer membrane beta-barrel domain-containing protein n=1 Tax=Candidatus Devosia phytovorans TaxID=3121372 RepID=A0AAJ6AYP3_9HYPH|nr:autotransporter outer membrane beta-barrel domain-containing protein [Devosia sp.]WEK03815.1 MAG: autotransporter outer membrane beta-barrel domain-containing protein [Devosia sp.]
MRLLPAALLLALIAAAPAKAQGTPDLGQMMERNRIIVANLPTTSDRTDRIKGTVQISNSAGPFMKALPGVMSGSPIPVAASLAAFDKLGGNRKPRLYDLWVKGRAMPKQESSASHHLATLSTGVDYLVSEKLLLGTFAQTDLAASAAIAGWSLGGFGTARLSENLYVDVLGARGGLAGQSQASNWLMTTSLTGKWTANQWTFGPQVKLTHFSASAPEGVDADGAIIEAQRKATSELAVGPSVSYKLTTVNKIIVTTGLKLNTVANLVAENGTDLAVDGIRSGLEGTLNIDLPSGTRWKSSIGYDGIGQGGGNFNLKGTLSVSLD